MRGLSPSTVEVDTPLLLNNPIDLKYLSKVEYGLNKDLYQFDKNYEFNYRKQLILDYFKPSSSYTARWIKCLLASM